MQTEWVDTDTSASDGEQSTIFGNKNYNDSVDTFNALTGRSPSRVLSGNFSKIRKIHRFDKDEQRGIKKLMKAIFFTIIDDYVNGDKSSKEKALQWLKSKKDSGVLSCEEVCGALNLSVKQILRVLPTLTAETVEKLRNAFL